MHEYLKLQNASVTNLSSRRIILRCFSSRKKNFKNQNAMGFVVIFILICPIHLPSGCTALNKLECLTTLFYIRELSFMDCLLWLPITSCLAWYNARHKNRLLLLSPSHPRAASGDVGCGKRHALCRLKANKSRECGCRPTMGVV